MTIDQITIRFYKCCKCKHQWTNWDRINQKDGGIPVNCPHCRNVRWNQRYTEEDLIYFRRLEDQMYKKNAERQESGYLKMLSRGKDTLVDVDYIDFITYDFLYKMRPQPDIYEIKQILQIPKSKFEQRHELMLSMIYDRIRNADKYEKEHYSKYSTWKSSDSRTKVRKYHIHDIRRIMRRRMQQNCKHREDPEILTALYRPTSWDFSYLDHEIGPYEMQAVERLPGEEAAYAIARERLNAMRAEAIKE